MKDKIKELCLKWYRYGALSNPNTPEELKYLFEGDWLEKKDDPHQIKLLREIILDCTSQWLKEEEAI